ncbi:MAG: Asp23/Gls24 family envelope stress response protein [Acutalibacteraceae bacterium]|jgi:uncharacterized alkaline shock family protein YloU|nr:Asp23/Gls24 family envelope stress response protein [Clostridia bacterium]MEE0808970.1 Asp23/Gls24 family envelope stress response protein [Acutalibacteraceae bacterium]
MQDNRTELSVSTEVLEKMAELAALEIEGVESLCKKSIDIKGSIKSKSAFKGVKVENINGAIDITVFICIKRSASLREVAEAVQKNVKDKIQTMTGTAVTRVNVNVQDILIDDEENVG